MRDGGLQATAPAVTRFGGGEEEGESGKVKVGLRRGVTADVNDCRRPLFIYLCPHLPFLHQLCPRDSGLEPRSNNPATQAPGFESRSGIV